MGKPSVRLSVDAIDHFEPVVAIPYTIATASFDAATTSFAPIRGGVGAKGNTDFINQLVGEAVQVGLPLDQAERFLAAALTAPTIAMKDAFGPGVLQSVLVRDEDEDECLRITITGDLFPNPRGGELKNSSAAIELFDPTNSIERASLVVDLSIDALSYPVPSASDLRTFSVALVGNPTRMGIVESGYSWNELMRSMGRVLNVDVEFRVSQQNLKDVLPLTTELALLFDPALEGALRDANPALNPVGIECAGRNLREVARDVALQVLETLEVHATKAPVGERKKLAAGDKVFHRKVGTSAAFDRFGDPCKVCSHNSFVRYFRAVKAEKGMARLYENFEPNMLYHCSKGYNCGIYAVFAPAKL